MIVGCFTLHLYCENNHPSWTDKHGIHMGEFTGESRTESYRHARKAGWRIVGNRSSGQAFCPKCAKGEKK